MAELTGLDLGIHLKSIVGEFAGRGSIYGYPKSRCYLGHPGFDLSVDFHGKRAETPLGPAAGPHTQMAQNIVLSFLGGGRIMELKTVQILDRLKISRPCIDARNVGYNVEWSQELRLRDSYLEYVNAWVLLKIIEEMELLGIPKGDPFYDTVFDMSVGYDLDGIASPEIHGWIKDMMDAGEAIEKALETLPAEFAQYRKLAIDPCISDTLTLSTFHGCPPETIEAICEHLIGEHRLNVIVKKNPTLLGFERVSGVIHRDLGYEDIELDREAFEHDLQFADGVAMMKRLERFAGDHGVRIGSKFTNTLVVKNNKAVFSDEVMYLSGPPLHVLAMNAMLDFRREMGAHYHTSFSAGINVKNIADSVGCGMRPISVCTDLLKTGGYTRMATYAKAIRDALEKTGVTTVGDFIVKKAGIADADEAALANLEAIVPTLASNPLYGFETNRKDPPTVDSKLDFFDCITCNKCLPVCPNGANFFLPIGEVKESTIGVRMIGGEPVAVPREPFVLEKRTQIANLADFCNECGECDAYCPESGAPFVQKPRFFFNRETYEEFRGYDGFYFPDGLTLEGRYRGNPYRLSFDAVNKCYHWRSADVELRIDMNNRLLGGRAHFETEGPAEIDMDPFYAMKALFHGIVDHRSTYPSIMLGEK